MHTAPRELASQSHRFVDARVPYFLLLARACSFAAHGTTAATALEEMLKEVLNAKKRVDAAFEFFQKLGEKRFLL